MIGERVGAYRLVAKLGEGGMGVVYVAEHLELGHRVAVKLLLPELSQNQEVVQRFFNEARAATKIKHPGIVQVVDFGRHASGAAYFAMELFEGESLSARLKQTGVLPTDQIAQLGRQACNALAAAHAQGIVHRDLKPDNIMLVPDPDIVGGERAKILDFGIAKLAAEVQSVSLKTRTGSLMGTPYYMSPEQSRGAGEVDWRSDIYAMGCILFEMACGRPPFTGEGLGEILGKHQFVPPPPPRSINPGVPVPLEQLIMQALAKEPGQRQQSMQELSQQLAALVPGQVSGGHAIARVTAPDHGPMVTPFRPAVASSPGGFAPTTLGGSAAQVTAGEPPSRSKAPLFALIAVVVLGGGATTAYLMSRGDGKAKGAAIAAASPTPTAAPAAPTPSPTPTPTPATPTPLAVVDIPVVGVEGRMGNKDGTTSSPVPSPSPSPVRSPKPSPSRPPKPTPSEPPLRRPPPDEVECLLKPELPGCRRRTPKPDPGPLPGPSERLDKSDIVAGMAAVKGRVQECFEQFQVPGTAIARISISPSGGIASVNVTGNFAGTPTGACVENAVKKAKFRQFSGPPMAISYPFALR